MSFSPPSGQTPTTITRLTITLTKRIEHGDQGASNLANYSLVLLDQNDNRILFAGDTGNLVPHLTAQETTQLQSFMDTLYNRAVTQIIGE